MKNLVKLLLIGSGILFFSCGPHEPKQKIVKIPYTKRQIDSIAEAGERAYNKMEEDNILSYISTHGAMERAPMGYWYAVLSKNEKGKQIEDNSMVRYSRLISRCEGTVCYNDTMLLKIGNGNEIRGMHEALKTLKKGEKARFIFPSYLAYGLMGDENKIPPKAELVYEVEILDVK